jgi:fatty acid-binding protein DegV
MIKQNVGDGLVRPAGLASTHKNFINKIFKFIETIYTNQVNIIVIKTSNGQGKPCPLQIFYFLL